MSRVGRSGARSALVGHGAMAALVRVRALAALAALVRVRALAALAALVGVGALAAKGVSS